LTLILRPPGRGNWSPLVLAIEGKRAAPLLVWRGQLLTLGGVVYRIARVQP
jgi:hypothetical protein